MAIFCAPSHDIPYEIPRNPPLRGPACLRRCEAGGLWLLELGKHTKNHSKNHHVQYCRWIKYTYPSEKYEFVSWDDSSQHMEK